MHLRADKRTRHLKKSKLTCTCQINTNGHSFIIITLFKKKEMVSLDSKKDCENYQGVAHPKETAFAVLNVAMIVSIEP